MAMAVALPTGLITPVIRHCDQLSLREIATIAKDLAGKAKAGSLKPEDYSGGTFTISNLGMLGIESFTAIINPPQAAILAVGATIATPWVRDGAVVVEQRMNLTMSCDHRVIDGALGAQLLATIVRNLEDPLAMLA
jgi:pyruvate dehydrogenase E2 component (dihydrolipoamide acetyltransferase)